ncbi:restriction endonuclease subunit S [Campylobacter lari]|nr:restriction endonuclease subunit S [Campylobacter lari]
MNNWKKCKLGDICSKVISGGTPLTSNALYYNGIIPWLNTKEVKNCRIYETEKYISQLGLENSSAKWIEANSVIVAMYGATAGKVAINKIPLTTNQACCNLTINHEKADYNFIYYLILNNFETLEILATGAAQQNLNLNTITSLEITLPPLEEQRQVAAILSSIDDKIELLHEQNKTLEELAQTLFRHYFIENPNPSWQEKPLSEIARFLNGLACQKYPPKNFLDKLPVLKIKELSDGAIGKNSDYASSEIADDYIVNSGDVIFSWSATLMVKIWGGEKSVLNQHLFKVSSDKYPKWFFYYWTKHHLREFITISQAHATTMGHIKRKDLDNAMCKIPKDEYLKKCDLEISPKIQKIENNLNQIRTLENMRDILIPKLLNGEIRSK